MAKKQGFQVAYRIGGQWRFQWRLVSEVFDTLDAAKACEEELEKQGYRSLIASNGGFRHGLPETFEPNDNPGLFEVINGWHCRK